MAFASAMHDEFSPFEQLNNFAPACSKDSLRMWPSVMHASYSPRPLATAERKNIDSIWNQHFKRFGADALTKSGS